MASANAETTRKSEAGFLSKKFPNCTLKTIKDWPFNIFKKDFVASRND
jgi:hypothetical protein